MAGVSPNDDADGSIARHQGIELVVHMHDGQHVNATASAMICIRQRLNNARQQTAARLYYEGLEQSSALMRHIHILEPQWPRAGSLSRSC